MPDDEPTADEYESALAEDEKLEAAAKASPTGFLDTESKLYYAIASGVPIRFVPKSFSGLPHDEFEGETRDLWIGRRQACAREEGVAIAACNPDKKSRRLKIVEEQDPCIGTLRIR